MTEKKSGRYVSGRSMHPRSTVTEIKKGKANARGQEYEISGKAQVRVVTTSKSSVKANKTSARRYAQAIKNLAKR